MAPASVTIIGLFLNVNGTSPSDNGDLPRDSLPDHESLTQSPRSTCGDIDQNFTLLVAASRSRLVWRSQINPAHLLWPIYISSPSPLILSLFFSFFFFFFLILTYLEHLELMNSSCCLVIIAIALRLLVTWLKVPRGLLENNFWLFPLFHSFHHCAFCLVQGLGEENSSHSGVSVSCV